MKKVTTIIGSMTLLIFSSSCSSVKVTNNWKDIETSSLSSKNVLVVSKTDNDVARIQFETDMVENLSKSKVKAVESFKMYPNLSLNRDMNQEELNQYKSDLLEIGIDIVITNVLKDIQKYEETVIHGSEYYVSVYPTFYYRGYRRGFYRYSNTYYVNEYPTTQIMSKGKKYILETQTFDLTKPTNNQLISVITTVLDNPETMGSVSKDFSKKVINELVK